jgi:hypothetical protein
MSNSTLKKYLRALLAAITTIGFVGIASVHANNIYSGSISGIFSDPVLTGYALDLNGNHIPLDNTTTAVDTGFGTNSITWGDASPSSSSLTFTGKSFSGVAPDQVFDLGTITYFNGSSTGPSLIFGAALTLAVNSTMGGSVDPGVAHLGFIATANGGVNERRDADFITFDVFPLTFNVFEGHTASAELFGKIVGDPFLTVTGIQLNPGQEDNGFIGQGQPSVPDSAGTLGLMGLALGALAVLSLSKKNVPAIR